MGFNVDFLLNFLRRFGRRLGGLVAAAAMVSAVAMSGSAMAEGAKTPDVYGKIEWGLWIDTDGCMHWWADGGSEGYMLDRVDPKTGRAMCLKKNTCLIENTDVLFDTDKAVLTDEGRRRLSRFFKETGAFGYAIYGHTDSRASDSYNQRLSERRAAAVADVARAAGALVSRQVGYGESRPVAPNDSDANMARNRRVEIVCYRWSR